ncbi:MAG: hypothetical protein NT018_01610 [Armatimonadetes bacterium]|nr:hypothetical protein [Armatimonadota bacterium]
MPTFPCHNCAKHIVAAGIERVVYVEPYPKSKAIEFHDDSITLGFKKKDSKSKSVTFEPFVGVGPRRFFDLFSMRLGSGRTLKRKDANGVALKWEPEDASPRMTLLQCSYTDLETLASTKFDTLRKEIKNEPLGGESSN